MCLPTPRVVHWRLPSRPLRGLSSRARPPIRAAHRLKSRKTKANKFPLCSPPNEGRAGARPPLRAAHAKPERKTTSFLSARHPTRAEQVYDPLRVAHTQNQKAKTKQFIVISMPLPPWAYKIHDVGRRVHGHAVGPVANRGATAATTGAHVMMGSVDADIGLE